MEYVASKVSIVNRGATALASVIFAVEGSDTIECPWIDAGACIDARNGQQFVIQAPTSDAGSSGVSWYLEFSAQDRTYIPEQTPTLFLYAEDKDLWEVSVGMDGESFFVEIGNPKWFGFSTRIPVKEKPSTPSQHRFDERRRPFYLIAHECNSLVRVKEALELGVNAVECDVFYGTRMEGGAWCDGGVPVVTGPQGWYVRHGTLPGKETWFSDGVPLGDWLSNVVSLEGSFPNQLVLLIFDIKTYHHLNELYAKICRRLPESLRVSCLLTTSTRDEAKAGGLNDIYHKLRSRDGLGIDGDNDVAGVESYFWQSSSMRFWYGNGIDHKLWETDNIRSSLKEAVIRRDVDHRIRKVYCWTYSDCDKIEYYIDQADSYGRHAVDGVMIELSALKRRNFVDIIRRKYNLRLAKRSDNSFLPFSPPVDQS